MNQPAPRSFYARYWPVLLLILGVASVLWPVLGLPASFASLIGILAMPRPAPSELPRAGLWIAAGALCASVGMVRFVVNDAVPGIVGGGRRAVEQEAVSRLRDVLFAEDAMRRAAWIDPDRDGIGSAAYLEELCGAEPLRGQAARDTPVLHCGELVETPLGLAARSGAYLYTVCLPQRGGGFSARPGGEVDEELAERRFVAYAWPEAAGGFDEAFFIDEHENIRMSPSMAAPFVAAPSVAASQAPAAPPSGFVPRCDAALGEPAWAVWRGKKPRPELPGDPAAGHAEPPPP